jgi:hypothetical protein
MLDDNNLRDIGQSISEDLHAFSYLKGVARNYDPRKWFAYQLSLVSIEWNESLVTKILETISDARAWQDNFDSIFPSIMHLAVDSKAKGTVRFIFFALLANAAQSGCKLPAEIRWGDAKIHNELLGNGTWLHYFSRIAIDLIAESQRPDKKSELRPFIKNEVLKGTNFNHKTLTANVSFIARYMLCNGITSYKQMTPESFSQFMIESAIAMPSSAIAWRQVCYALEVGRVLPHEWCNDVELLFTRRPVESRIAKLNDQNLFSTRDAQHKNVEYKEVCRSEEIKLLGEVCHNSTVQRVLIPIVNKGIVEFGDITINKSTTEYAPNNIEDGLWKRAQLAFCNVAHIEKNTSKDRARALQYLNSYVYSYLPKFFEKNENCLFEYPDTPSKFIGSVFFLVDPVIDYQYQKTAEASGKDVIYPVSLFDFIDALVQDNSRDDDTDFNERNTIREALATLRRFFQTIIDEYHEIDGYNLKSNPIRSFRNVGYKARSKSSKDIFHLGYWVIFRIFLKELAKTLLIISAKRARKLLENDESEYVDILKLELNKIHKIPCFEHLQNTIDSDSNSIFIPATIALGGMEFDIGTIEYPSNSKSITKKIKMGKSLTMVPLANYHHVMILVIAAYAGQRASNAAYLCADTFDSDYTPLINGVISERLVPLRIRTDKVKPTGLDSMISEEIMVMLRFARTLRQLYSEEAYTQPIPYQDNEQSKNGKFRPLLQSTSKNSDYHFSISPYIKMFEDWLTKTGIPFVSKLSYAPINATIRSLDHAKKHGSIINAPSYLIKYSNESEPHPFTPIVQKTAITIHSLRTQLVTVIHAATGDSEAVRMFTGQSDGTINFYTKLDIETDKVLAPIREKYRIASVTESVVREEDLINAVTRLDGNASPFFAGSEVGLNALKESGGRGLALNYTHICPHDNQCPEEVINTHGRMNCHECSRACITEHHKVAISAVIRRNLDEINDASAMLKNSTNQAEQDTLRIQLTNSLYKASCWFVRLRHIEDNPGSFMILGAKNIEQFRIIPSDDISNKLFARLQETNGAPSMQSNYLQRMASMIAGKIQVMAMRETLPSFDNMQNYDPVRFVVQNLTLLAELKNTTPEKLLDLCMEQKTLDINLLEELKIV